MQELDDVALLREYVERDSEEAFAALVTRHINSSLKWSADLGVGNILHENVIHNNQKP